MASTIRIKRRTSGNPGAPSSLFQSELAFNEVDKVLYYGYGTGGGGGTAGSIIGIAGEGAFVTIGTAQTITGAKTFTGGISATLSNALSIGAGLSQNGTTYDGSAARTISLPLTGVTAQSYGSATSIPIITVDAYGRITAASTTSISTSINLSGNSGTGSVAGGGTLNINGGTGITTNASGSGVTISIDSTVVTLTGSQVLTNKTLTSPVISTIVNTGTLTLPTSTDTLVGRGTTDTFTNKTYDTAGTGNVFRINGNQISGYTGTGSSVVLSTSPTLTTPTIGAATATSITGSSGNLTITAASGNNNINLVPTGTGTVDVGSARITNVATPTQSTDAASKAYVDAVKTGLDVKDSVRVASTSNIVVTYNATGGTSGRGIITVAPNVIDGVTLNTNDRILLKDQSTGAQNGIWVVTTVGTGSNGTWDRATDFDTDAEVTSGAFTFVEEGSVNADSGWVLTTNNPITIGGASGTSLSWAQFSGAGQITAGNGLSKSGSVIDVNVDSTTLAIVNDTLQIASGYSGQTSITTLGTISTGTWSATTIAVNKGGTGLASTPTSGQLLIGNNSNGYTLGTLTAGTGITVANASGSITITNTGVTSLGVSGNGISINGSTGSLTISTGATSANTNSTIVFRDAAGAFSAGAITATSLTLTTDLAVSDGGTGTNTFTAKGILYGNGTSAIQVTAAAGGADASTSNQILTVDGSGVPVWTTTIDGGSF